MKNTRELTEKEFNRTAYQKEQFSNGCLVVVFFCYQSSSTYIYRNTRTIPDHHTEQIERIELNKKRAAEINQTNQRNENWIAGCEGQREQIVHFKIVWNKVPLFLLLIKTNASLGTRSHTYTYFTFSNWKWWLQPTVIVKPTHNWPHTKTCCWRVDILLVLQTNEWGKKQQCWTSSSKTMWNKWASEREKNGFWRK